MNNDLLFKNSDTPTTLALAFAAELHDAGLDDKDLPWELSNIASALMLNGVFKQMDYLEEYCTENHTNDRRHAVYKALCSMCGNAAHGLMLLVYDLRLSPVIVSAAGASSVMTEQAEASERLAKHYVQRARDYGVKIRHCSAQASHMNPRVLDDDEY